MLKYTFHFSYTPSFFHQYDILVAIKGEAVRSGCGLVWQKKTEI